MTRVAYIGNFKHPFCTEVYIARALEENGCDVWALQAEDMIDPTPEAIARVFELGVPDLCLYTRTHTRQMALPAKWTQWWRRLESEGTVTASLHLDRFWDLERETLITSEPRDPLFTTQHVFTADGGNQHRFAEVGVNHHYLPPGVDRQEAEHLAAPDPRMAHDVLFVGSGGSYHPEYPARLELLRFLRDRFGRRFAHYGHGGDHGVVRGLELNTLYRSSAVAVGDSCFANQINPAANYVSDRLFETIGRGGFLVWPWSPGLSDFYKTGRHFVTHVPGDWEDLAAQIDTYMGRPGERVGIAEQGRAYTLANHTWAHRMADLLCAVGLGDCGQNEAAA